MTRVFLTTPLAFAASLALASPTWAADAPTADEISAAVSDHTYQGSMSSGGSGFSEYYAADGSIRGRGLHRLLAG